MATPFIAIDIETGPDETKEVPEPRYSYGNTKDETKRERIREEQRAKQLDKRALSPYFARVLSLHLAHRGPVLDRGVITVWPTGWKTKQLKTERPGNEARLIYNSSENPLSPTGLTTLTALATPDAESRDRNEIETIGAALAYLLRFAQEREATIVTFHGQNFDFPMLRRRLMILGGSPIYVPCGARNGHNKGHLDVGVALADSEPGGWQPSDPMGIGFALFAYSSRLLGKTSPIADVPKTQYAEWFAAGDVAALQSAGDWDAARTLELAELYELHYM